MTKMFVINEELRKSVEGTTLFYPCSGNDFRAPLQLFSPFISEFWFVDKGYYNSIGASVERARRGFPLNEREYELIQETVVGGDVSNAQCKALRRLYGLIEKKKDIWNDQNRAGLLGGPETYYQYPFIEPCVLTEVYRHRPTGKTVKVHRRRGFGTSALDQEIASIGVFYYRGDSMGEGGSGDCWLCRPLLQLVLSKLVSGGLLVTDGSQGERSSEYQELWKFHDSDVGKEAVDLVMPFTDKDGVAFSCVGYAGQRYGPTLIWRVVKPTPSAPQ
ncbi:MAG: hypothetical protein NTW75_07045 [Planctomycetales bacterium]|nr:hypothetical protein [Planctomycetales bacterium]